MKILIAITTGDHVCNETMESIYNLIRPKDVSIGLRIIRNYDVAWGRNYLVNMARDNKADYIFFVDSDVILPQDALIKLYDMRCLIALGTYPRKESQTLTSQNPFTTLYRHNDINKTHFGPFFLPQNELPLSGAIPVDCGGLGCALIRMDVFDKLEYPWFVFVREEVPEGGGEYCIGEDMYFFRNCLRKNIQPYAEGSVRCGHVGQFIYTFKDNVPNQMS